MVAITVCVSILYVIVSILDAIVPNQKCKDYKVFLIRAFNVIKEYVFYAGLSFTFDIITMTFGVPLSAVTLGILSLNTWFITTLL